MNYIELIISISIVSLAIGLLGNKIKLQYKKETTEVISKNGRKRSKTKHRSFKAG
ncbi:hypothetical protein HP548_23630 [Paenibacillus taichungensis]|uniref:Uncharacterized protein n=1 Tax=Paenibacillus taichungensis TaxID=484184 RepID=A0ABX2MSP3_9BACL|nr:hypothetical protein [Paenibacillus taichungensis]NUU57076.1 hypothetical protein [Paenibacillus taichungensis]